MDMSNGAVARAAGWLTAWDSHPIHRTGTAGDVAGAAWLMSEVEKLGAQPVLEEFTLDRLDPIASYIEIDGIRIEGVPVFNSPRPQPKVSPAGSGRWDRQQRSGLSNFLRMRFMRRNMNSGAAARVTKPWSSSPMGRGPVWRC